MLYTDTCGILIKTIHEDLLLGNDEPSKFVVETIGEIFDTDVHGKETLIGKVEFTFINGEDALNEYFALSDVWDTAEWLSQIYDAIFNQETDELKESIIDLLKEPICALNALIVTRLELVPEYRGHNLGLIVVRELVKRFGCGADFVLLLPFVHPDHYIEDASDWIEKLDMVSFARKNRIAKHLLCTHFGKLGFKLIPDTPLMIFNRKRSFYDVKEI